MVERAGPLKSSSTTRRIIETLAEQHPNADTELHYSTPFELLVATILSAQSTDARVNIVTPALFKRYPDAAALAKARPAALEKQIVSTGFFRQKSKALIGMAKALVTAHDGQVPPDMDLLTKLPGVGRKTANVVRSVWFDEPGLPVDTHVTRLSHRLGLTQETDPVKIEFALNAMVPAAERGGLSLRLILHGRRVCDARSPKCDVCVLEDFCPSSRLPRKRSA